MFEQLAEINSRPKPFEFYTASDLWTDDHTSRMMLACHLDKDVDRSSRNARFIDRSVEWIGSRFNITAGTRIADFGCGPGLYAAPLAKRQAAVTGIDFSARSIEYAREVSANQGLSIDYVHQNYLDFETEDHFELILMIMCDFCALSPLQRQKMLSTFYTMLEPGGSALLDVYSLTAFDRREETAMYEANLFDGFWSPNDYYGFLNTFKYENENVVLDKFTIVEKTRSRTVYNWLQYFSRETIENEFAESGFSVDEFYADVAGWPFAQDGEGFAVVATKP